MLRKGFKLIENDKARVLQGGTSGSGLFVEDMSRVESSEGSNGVENVVGVFQSDIGDIVGSVVELQSKTIQRSGNSI